MFKALAALAVFGVLFLGFKVVIDYKIIPRAAADDQIGHFISTAVLAKACAEDPNGHFCAGYILGAGDAWDMASLYWPSIRCRSTDISGGEFVEVAKQWIKDHAKDSYSNGASVSAASQILQLTRVKWPCLTTKDSFDEEGLRLDRPL